MLSSGMAFGKRSNTVQATKYHKPILPSHLKSSQTPRLADPDIQRLIKRYPVQTAVVNPALPNFIKQTQQIQDEASMIDDSSDLLRLCEFRRLNEQFKQEQNDLTTERLMHHSNAGPKMIKQMFNYDLQKQRMLIEDQIEGRDMYHSKKNYS